MSVTEKKLQALRKRIDEADRKLLRALGDRQATVQKIGVLKAKSGMTAHQKSRWEEVIAARLKEGRRWDLRESFVESIFNAIHAESLRIQAAEPVRKAKTRKKAT